MTTEDGLVWPIWAAPKECPGCLRAMYYSTSAGGHVHDHTGGFLCDSAGAEGLHDWRCCETPTATVTPIRGYSPGVTQ